MYELLAGQMNIYATKISLKNGDVLITSKNSGLVVIKAFNYTSRIAACIFTTSVTGEVTMLIENAAFGTGSSSAFQLYKSPSNYICLKNNSGGEYLCEVYII